MLRQHGPIVKTAGAALAAYVLVVLPAVDVLARKSLSPALALVFLLGILYTQFFEYAAHRFAMHRGIPWLSNVRRNHLEHHRVFHGERFRSRKPADLEHIAGRWWLFPLLFTPHYLTAAALLPLEAAMAFLLGTLFHYLLFETTHWFTHVGDNALDRFLRRIPWVGSLRAYQIEHHRIHHELPIVAFNFNPPYLGDRLSERMPTRRRLRSLGVNGIVTGRDLRPAPAASVVFRELAPTRPSTARSPAFTRPLARYGLAALLAVAALGLAAAAHGYWGRERPRGVSKQAKLAKA